MKAYGKDCYFLLKRENEQIFIVLKGRTVGSIACLRAETVSEGFSEQLMTSSEKKYGFKPGSLPLVII